MRILLSCTLALLGMIGAARAADFEPPVPGYGVAPPPMYAPPPRYGYAPPPPRYGYVPPQPWDAPPPVVAFGPPPRPIAVPRGPGYGYPDDDYAEFAPEVADPGFHRHCWWEWGERRCAPVHGW